LKTILKNYLSVTKREWNGLVILMVLIVAVWLSPYIYQYFHTDNVVDTKGFTQAAARLQRAEQSSDTSTGQTAVLFRFNPNHLPDDQWRKLGLSDRQIGMIDHYQAKGGKFNYKTDLQKIYAITAGDYQRLEPYINLPGRGENAQPAPTLIIELNGADSAKLTRVSGIGPGYAVLIRRYRDRLGGFYKKEQLKEIVGIDSLTYLDIFPQVKVNTSLIKKMNINKISMSSFQVFPYLSYKQKNAIIEYRNQHGNYTSLADLRNIPIIDEGILRKIEPYIAF
jgi:DNA uptake protein ComE-like DNA-binding protein